MQTEDGRIVLKLLTHVGETYDYVDGWVLRDGAVITKVLTEQVVQGASQLQHAVNVEVAKLAVTQRLVLLLASEIYAN